MNKSDSERIAAVLESVGYKNTSKINEADLIIVNMCSVRQSAVDRAFGLNKKLKELKTINYKLKTILTGCILKRDERKLKEKFDLILDIKDLPNLAQKLNHKPVASLPVIPSELSKNKLNKTKNYLKIQPKYSTNFIAFVPIMTGCNNFCSFCVVPYTRNREISRSAKDIIYEIKNLIKKGYKEIWLLGQNVNSYKPVLIKTGSKNINFPKLLEMINDIDGNFWIRFTSSHPKDFSDKLIKTMAQKEKITPYLNLPVQSGDNQVLKKMNRPYTIKQYKNIVKKIRKKIPDITLSTDVIVGFPGETKKQFENTVKLFKEIKFDMAYIAQYSSRPETIAAKLKDNISRKEKEKRWKILTEILKKTALEKNKKYIGKIKEVLPEYEKNGWLVGKTKEYKTIKIPILKTGKNSKFIGKFVKVKVINASPWRLEGKLT